MNFTRQYLAEVGQILLQLDADAIERVVPLLAETRAADGCLSWGSAEARPMLRMRSTIFANSLT